MSIQIFCPFKKISCVFYLVVRDLYIFWIQVPHHMYDLQIFFLHPVGCLFTFLMVSFGAQKVLTLLKCSLSFFVVALVLVSYLTVYCQIGGYADFSCLLQKIYTFIFSVRSLIHLELIFINIPYGSELISKGM